MLRKTSHISGLIHKRLSNENRYYKAVTESHVPAGAVSPLVGVEISPSVLDTGWTEAARKLSLVSLTEDGNGLRVTFDSVHKAGSEAQSFPLDYCQAEELFIALLAYYNESGYIGVRKVKL